MRVLFVGDVLGRSGRRCLNDHLQELRKSLKIDFVIANGENAAAGFGITEGIADELFAAGVDCISGGNHTFDQNTATPLLEKDKRILRPQNYPKGTPGSGVGRYKDGRGRNIIVINVMGRVFMDPLDDPFKSVDDALKIDGLGRTAHFVFIDIHAEATSEKMAMGQYLDGSVSAVVGTHSHIPTADAQILPKGTAYQTDAGMCGDYDSVIGMEKEEPIKRFLTKLRRGRFSPALGEGTFCGVFIESDDKTGLANRVEPVRLGGRLKTYVPTL
ncbi:MAG: TIGR00282 family metallophosphoesterase [Sphingomonadales bacterium]